MYFTTKTGRGVYQTIHFENSTFYKFLFPTALVIAFVFAVKLNVIHYILITIISLLMLSIPFIKNEKVKKKARVVEPTVGESPVVEEPDDSFMRPNLRIQKEQNKLDNYKNIQKSLREMG